MEPIMSPEGLVMVDFLFAEEHFLAAETTTRNNYRSLVALNAFYLVVAALNQRK